MVVHKIDLFIGWLNTLERTLLIPVVIWREKPVIWKETHPELMGCGIP
jgi:hypothetical protein